MQHPFFIFIVPHTPKQFRDELRDRLFEITLESLKKQTYVNWRAYIISDEDKIDGNLHFINSEATSKKEKLIKGLELVASLNIKPDFIIRFDDDDIINPGILEKASKLDFECMADEFHAFYDVISGYTALQKRNWFANTVIHKYKHAIKEDGGVPLLLHDHSKSWHIYYRDKEVIYSKKEFPLYLRILSPTSITAGGNLEIETANNRIKRYRDYLQGFGRWKTSDIQVFSDYKNILGSLSNEAYFKPFSRFRVPSTAEYYINKLRNKFFK